MCTGLKYFYIYERVARENDGGLCTPVYLLVM